MLSITTEQGEVLWPHHIQGSLLCQEPTLWSLSCCLNPEWLRGAIWLEETAHWTASVDPRLCPDSPQGPVDITVMASCLVLRTEGSSAQKGRGPK